MKIRPGEKFVSPLVHAARRGETTILQLLLDKGKGVSINDEDCHKLPVLYHALKNKRAECALLLLNREANLKVKTNVQYAQDDFPLHLATRNGMYEVVEKLLELGDDPNAVNKKKKTPVHEAAQMGHLRILKLLLTKGGKWDVLDDIKRYPLHWAACCNPSKSPECCQILLETAGGQAEDYAASYDNYYKTPLILATEKGILNSCKILTEYSTESISCTKKSLDWNTALHVAAMGSRCDIIKLLLDRKPTKKLSQNRHGQTVIHLLINKAPEFTNMKIESEYFRCLEYLLRYFDQDAGCNKLEQSLIWLATKRGWTKALELLLSLEKHAHHINTPNKVGITPLRVALRNGNWEIINIFLSKNCDLTVADNFKNTAIHFAASNGMYKVCKLLLEKTDYTNWDTPNSLKRTPLHLSAKNGSLDCVHLFYTPISPYDSEGFTPFLLSVESGNLSVIQYFISKNVAVLSEKTLNSNETALHLAVKKGHDECCIYLLRKMDWISVCATNNNNRTALDEAFYNRHINIFALILSKAPPPDPTKITEIELQTSLHMFAHFALVEEKQDENAPKTSQGIATCKKDSKKKEDKYTKEDKE